MPRLFRWSLLVVAGASLTGCAGSQSGWRETYATAPEYYDSSPTYGYRHEGEHERERPPGRCRNDRYGDRYGDYRDDDTPYRY